MAITFEPPPTYAEVVIVDETGSKPRFNPIWLKWFVDIAALLTSSGGGSGGIVHNNTTSIQGGSAGQRYHLTSTQASAVASMVTNGISTVITTAKLTGGGANGSMTFVGGILTASTPAT